MGTWSQVRQTLNKRLLTLAQKERWTAGSSALEQNKVPNNRQGQNILLPFKEYHCLPLSAMVLPCSTASFLSQFHVNFSHCTNCLDLDVYSMCLQAYTEHKGTAVSSEALHYSFMRFSIWSIKKLLLPTHNKYLLTQIISQFTPQSCDKHEASNSITAVFNFWNFLSGLNLSICSGKNDNLCTGVNQSKFNLRPRTLTITETGLFLKATSQVWGCTGTELQHRDKTEAQGTTNTTL